MIRIIPLSIDVGEDFEKFILNVAMKIRFIADDNDILVFASKPILKAKKMYINLDDVEPGSIAKKIAEKYDLDPRMAELIIRYSDRVIGGVKEVLLTFTKGVFTANAGLDRKNIGEKYVALPPHLLIGTAKEIHRKIYEMVGLRLGIVITDSVVYPLRLGTRAYAVDIYGFNPVRDYRGSKDLYGRRIRYTLLNLADEIASAAHLAMGEGDEGIPVVLIKGVKIEPGEKYKVGDLLIRPEDCLYNSLYRWISESEG